MSAQKPTVKGIEPKHKPQGNIKKNPALLEQVFNLCSLSGHIDKGRGISQHHSFFLTVVTCLILPSLGFLNCMWRFQPQ